MDQPIKSPINYTGNKYRLLEQFRQFFPKKTGVFIDLFCGGATVGFNVDAEKIVLIDNNRRIIGLLDFLAKENISGVLMFTIVILRLAQFLAIHSITASSCKLANR